MGTATLTTKTTHNAAPTASRPNTEWKPDRASATAADLQGLTISAYAAQLFASLMLVSFPTGPDGKPTGRPNSWIAALAPRITNATGPQPTCLNLTFSAAGLALLGLPDGVLETFSLPFQQGMTTESRARFLGDNPSTWQWSDCAENANCVHAQLMIYALDQTSLDAAVDAETATLASFGLTLSGQILQRVNQLPDGQRHEHFGFADGISQPNLVDISTPGIKLGLNEIAVGEMILGQINTYGEPAAGPLVLPSPAAEANLQPAPTEGYFDLGINGTYVVVRQLKQDVARFWNNIKTAAADLVDEHNQPATDQWLAEKAVGRTITGAMLTPTGPVKDNDMTFFATDPNGFGCPITSHVRRSNPRDGLAPTAADGPDMIAATNRHRIVRRGRMYGTPVTDRYTPDTVDRGLVFICLNTDIQRQFEFIQHTWLLNPMFGGAYNETDPLLGSCPPIGGTTAPVATGCPFTIPSKPIRQRPVLETAITPVGGGYFFMPSLRALRYLGAL